MVSAADTDVPEVVGLIGGAAVAVDVEVDVLSTQESVAQAWPSLQQPPPREDAQEKKLDLQVEEDAEDWEMTTVEMMVVVSVLPSAVMVTVAVDV